MKVCLKSSGNKTVRTWRIFLRRSSLLKCIVIITPHWKATRKNKEGNKLWSYIMYIITLGMFHFQFVFHCWNNYFQNLKMSAQNTTLKCYSNCYIIIEFVSRENNVMVLVITLMIWIFALTLTSVITSLFKITWHSCWLCFSPAGQNIQENVIV